MTAPSDRRAIITEALRKIDDLTARLAIAEKAETEPIAVVGIGCRLPGGVDSADEFWTFLQEGRSGVVRVPSDRWDADAYYSADYTVPGTICNREGGFLTSWQPDEFDAEFFSISPREAAAVDPQQRLLLEVAWEALESAGINPQSVRGTQTGIFVGLTTSDYYHSVVGKLHSEDLDPYAPFGSAPNFAAGRLSYFLGAQGPAVVLDTACSSSLVSIHLACQSLRRKESDTALAAGVSLILGPENSIACSRFGMLSPTGACRTFDADADGYVRSEGCGVVVLKRLGDAERDGDRVLAVVRGSAVNQDGASSGQTVPNGPAQQALMRQALRAARLGPADVDYIEAHGTGTGLGDPIELDALAAVYGEPDRSAPLVLGSVKTNLGHLEAAAGVTGFIKTVLSVAKGHIPKQLHFTRLTPNAGPGAHRFRIAAEPMDWPGVDRPRRAAVSSFGVSGTNAHVIVEQAPGLAERAVPEPEPPVSTLVVTGRTPARIASMARRLADWMEADGAAVPVSEVAHTLNHHRAQYGRFATVTAADRAQAVAGLRALAEGYPAPGVAGPHDGPCGAGTVFVYSGQGSQWAGMGRQLLIDEPAFAAAVDELEPAFVEHVGFSLRAVLESGEPVVGIDRIQPVLVGVQLALTALWQACGVTPDAVIGHSMGEVSAAVVSGALTPADGLRVIATRSRLMARLSGQGAMALLELGSDHDADEAAEELIAGHPGVTVAVYAAPRQVVVAGPPEQVDAVIAAVAARDRLARRVDVDVASHHPIIDPVLPDLRAALSGLTPRTPSIPVFVTTGGQPTDGTAAFDADYWVSNLRNPVRFTQAVAAAGADHTRFIEVSPHPLLGYAIDETLSHEDAGGRHHHTSGTLLRDGNETLTFRANLNATHTARPPKPPHPAEPHVAIPGTPWHHTQHWLTGSAAPGDGHRDQGRTGDGPDWFHALTWRVRSLSEGVPTQRNWLVLADGDAGADLARLLGAGSRALPLSDLPAADDATLRTALAGADHVVVAPSAQTGRLDVAAGYRLFATTRRLLAVMARMNSAPTLFIATRNAQALDDASPADPVHAVLWGMGRTIRLENPDLWGGIVDVDGSVPAELLTRWLAAEAAGADEDDQTVYRRGVRYVPRLERRSAPTVTMTRLEGGTSHLVIGATGNVGPYLIRQLAEMGASTVVAVSRRGAGHLGGLAAELAQRGTTLVEVAADAADEAAMTALFERFGADLPALDGVYLAALAGGESLITEMTDADVTAMFRPKLDAAALLHTLSLTTPVRRFVLFSSITGILGSSRIGHYTAANAFLDALAHARSALGLPATVVDWGLWKSWADAQPSTAAAGLEPMPNDAAIRMLPAVLSPDAAVQSVVVGADWARIADAYGMRAPMPVLDELLGAGTAGTETLSAPEFGTLLGEQADGTGPARHWLAQLRPTAKPYPGGHRVRGVEVVPVSVLLQTLVAAVPGRVLTDVHFEYPVVVDRPRSIRVDLRDDSVALSSSTNPDAPADRWTRHCTARVADRLDDNAPGLVDAASDAGGDAPDFAELLRVIGVEGQAFPWTVSDYRQTAAGLQGTVDPSAEPAALLDGAVYLARLVDIADTRLMLPSSVEAIGVAGSLPGGAAVVVARRRTADQTGDLVVDIAVRDPDGATLVDIRGLRYASVESAPVADTDEIPAPVDAPAWSEMTAPEILAELRVRLRAILARELGMPESAVGFDTPFPELGLDSMMAMTLLRDAKGLVQRELSATMLWNHPTVSSFSAHVAGLLTPDAMPAEPSDDHGDVAFDSVSVLDALFESVESASNGGESSTR